MLLHTHNCINNMQAEKKRMIARLQAQQNVARCRDGANVFKVSKCCEFSFVLQHTNNHGHPYIDCTTVLSDMFAILNDIYNGYLCKYGHVLP